MLKSKKSGAKGSARSAAIDPDDAPILDDAFFDRAEIIKDGKVIQRGRPPVAGGKEAVKLRLDKDVLAHWRSTGPGWQTRINEELRRAGKVTPPAAADKKKTA